MTSTVHGAADERPEPRVYRQRWKAKRAMAM
jgi:hypothetical protein